MLLGNNFGKEFFFKTITSILNFFSLFRSEIHNNMELSKTLKCLISVVYEHTYNITVDIKTAPEIFVHFKNFNLHNSS